MDVACALIVLVICSMLGEMIDDKYGIRFFIITIISAISMFMWLLLRYNTNI